MPNREERRKAAKNKLSHDQTAMAFMIIRLAEMFEESMVDAGLTAEQIDRVRAGVARRQDEDMRTGYTIGVPDSKFGGNNA